MLRRPRRDSDRCCTSAATNASGRRRRATGQCGVGGWLRRLLGLLKHQVGGGLQRRQDYSPGSTGAAPEATPRRLPETRYAIPSFFISHHRRKAAIPAERSPSKSSGGISQLDKNSWEENPALNRLPEKTHLSPSSRARENEALCVSCFDRPPAPPAGPFLLTLKFPARLFSDNKTKQGASELLRSTALSDQITQLQLAKEDKHRHRLTRFSR